MSRRRLAVLDATGARPPLTGVGWSMVELVSALAAAAPDDFRFTLLTDAPELFAGVAGAPHWRLRPCRLGKGRTGRILRTQVHVPAAVRSEGADLLHSLTMPGLLRPPCPAVITVHDVAYRHVPGTIEGPRRLWYRWAVPQGLGRAARIVVNSETTATQVRAAFPAVADRVRVTPFGTPTWAATAPPRRSPPADDAPFLFVGALEPRKNLAAVLTALERVRARMGTGPLPVLRVVGAPGWRNSALLERLRKLADEGAVILEGHQEHPELLRRLHSARALLLPSLHEGFGFPILEGMAVGTPVITSDRGAMREVAGDAALLVDPEDPDSIAAAMLRIWSDRTLGEDLAARGRTRSRSWTWSATAAATLAAYREALG